MDQIHHHFSGPISVLGANYQSHYVPAEKPYAVYDYVYEGPLPAVAQLIGTMLTGKVNGEGNMVFKGKAVYRMPNKDFMMDCDHCFIPEDMGELKGEPVLLGFVGDTIGMDKVVDAIYMEQEYADETDIKRLIDNASTAGLKVDLGENCNMQSVTGQFDVAPGEYKKREYFLAVKDEIALRVKIYSDGKSESPYIALSKMWHQIESWKEVGVTFDKIEMIPHEAYYQDQADELLELAKLYGKTKKRETQEILLNQLLRCVERIGKGRCLYEEYVMGMKDPEFDFFNNFEKDLQAAIDSGFASRDGDIIQFSPEVVRMASWKWVWKP